MPREAVVRDPDGTAPAQPVTVELHSHQHTVKPKKADAAGRFSFSVGQGRYWATANTTIPNGSCTSEPFIVRRDQHVLTVVYCLRGIDE